MTTQHNLHIKTHVCLYACPWLQSVLTPLRVLNTFTRDPNVFHGHNVCAQRPKCICSVCKTRVQEDPNACVPGVKRVCMRTKMHCSMCEMLLLYIASTEGLAQCLGNRPHSFWPSTQEQVLNPLSGHMLPHPVHY